MDFRFGIGSDCWEAPYFFYRFKAEPGLVGANVYISCSVTGGFHTSLHASGKTHSRNSTDIPDAGGWTSEDLGRWYLTKARMFIISLLPDCGIKKIKETSIVTQSMGSKFSLFEAGEWRNLGGTVGIPTHKGQLIYRKEIDREYTLGIGLSAIKPTELIEGIQKLFPPKFNSPVKIWELKLQRGVKDVVVFFQTINSTYTYVCIRCSEGIDNKMVKQIIECITSERRKSLCHFNIVSL